MKQGFSFLLVFFAVSCFAQTGALRLSMDVWPPFTNVEGEKSIATEIVETALERVNISSSSTVTDFDDVMAGINSGAYDGSPALWKSEEREKGLIFSEPYLENQLILVGRKDADVAFPYFSGLAHKRIGIVENYAYGDSLMKVADLKIVYGKDDQENLVNLLSDKIDYMLVDALLIQYLLKYELNDVSRFLEFAEQAFIIRPLHLAIRKDTPNAESIIALFNEEVKMMIAEGSYNELLGLDWIRADINGDGIMEIVFSGEAAGTEPPEYAYNVHASDAGNTDQFYIGGNYYNSWDEVPDKYKISIPPPKGADAYDYGMTIKF